MEETIDGIDAASIDRAIPLLNTTQMVAGTSPSYDAMSGAIIWSDEYPTCEEPSDIDAVHEVLRPLWWHRTQQILGKPSVRYQRLWDHASQRCPNWAGFAPQRCVPDLKLAELHQARAEAFIRDFDRLVD